MQKIQQDALNSLATDRVENVSGDGAVNAEPYKSQQLPHAAAIVGSAADRK